MRRPVARKSILMFASNFNKRSKTERTKPYCKFIANIILTNDCQLGGRNSGKQIQVSLLLEEIVMHYDIQKQQF